MNIINKFKILTYNIGFISKDVNLVMKDGIQKGDIVWLKHQYKDRFFADPFLIDENERYLYVLSEEYTFWEELGRIVLLIVSKEDYSLVERRILIKERYHLSFPYCKKGGNWIMPEASASGAAYLYQYDKKAFKVIGKRKVCDVGLIDNVIYLDGDNDYLYAGKTDKPSVELYSFKKVNEEYIDEQYIQSDNRTSRSAGDFFKIGDNLYRPVQDCKERYGRQTKIMKINSIGAEGYSSAEECTLNSFQNPPFNETMHTFNVYDDIILVDGSKDFLRFPMKFFYRKCRWLFKNR